MPWQFYYAGTCAIGVYFPVIHLLLSIFIHAAPSSKRNINITEKKQTKIIINIL